MDIPATFSPAPRSKLQFARLFCDKTFSDGAALRWLRSEIQSNPHLLQQLNTLNYKKNSKMLTCMQQTVIYAYIVYGSLKQ